MLLLAVQLTILLVSFLWRRRGGQGQGRGRSTHALFCGEESGWQGRVKHAPGSCTTRPAPVARQRSGAAARHASTVASPRARTGVPLCTRLTMYASSTALPRLRANASCASRFLNRWSLTYRDAAGPPCLRRGTGTGTAHSGQGAGGSGCVRRWWRRVRAAGGGVHHKRSRPPGHLPVEHPEGPHVHAVLMVKGAVQCVLLHCPLAAQRRPPRVHLTVGSAKEGARGQHNRGVRCFRLPDRTMGWRRRRTADAAEASSTGQAQPARDMQQQRRPAGHPAASRARIGAHRWQAPLCRPYLLTSLASSLACRLAADASLDTEAPIAPCCCSGGARAGHG